MLREFIGGSIFAFDRMLLDLTHHLTKMIDPSLPLPLVDLHRHLEGNVRLDTILGLGRQHNFPLPAWDVEGLRPYVQVTEPRPSLMDFIAEFRWKTA